MVDLAKPRRRPLKVHPEPEEMLQELVRSLDRIATGLESVVQTIDALTVKTEAGELALRTVRA